MLASIDRRTAIGRRDYAILLLLARLGLRSGEVAFLELDDIDWNAGQVERARQEWPAQHLPLPIEVGKAIAAYLRQGTAAQYQSPRIFARQSPDPRLSRCEWGWIDRSAFASNVPASMPLPKGAHQFRHGLATEMLRQGASLGEIGELLGHRHPQTTKIYTKVDSRHCGHWLCRGREVCDEHTPGSRSGVLEMRRSLGFKLQEAGKGLIDFITFLEQHNASYITQELALAWAQQPSNVQPAHWAQRLSFVRGFARYRSATDPRTQIPPQGLLPFKPKRARPYLYSDEEIRSLLRAALDMPCRL